MKRLVKGDRLSESPVGQPVVAHVVFPYLFQTGSWLYGQIVNMRRYRPVVVTDRTENLDVFPFTRIDAYEGVSAPRKALLCLSRRRLRGAAEPFYEWVLRQRRARLIQAHFGTAGVILLRLKARMRLPMVTTFYGADVSQVPNDPAWRQQYRRLFDIGELFLAEGNAMRESIIRLGCPPRKVVLQRLGVDLDSLSFVQRQPDPSGVVRILVAGIFREKKGIPEALRAVEHVRQRYPRLTVTLMGDSAGKPGDEEEKSKILTLAGQLGEIVRWVGFQPYPVFKAALLEHHLLLSPSLTARDGDSEGGAPVSIIEAQATGMPVVSTAHADIPEIVIDGKTGLLSPERDTDALSSNLAHLVMNPDLWEPMGRAGRAHVEANHDIRAQVARLEEFYASLLGDEVARPPD